MEEVVDQASELKKEFETPGSNQSGMRDRNERLVLTLLRRVGPLSKANIARRTGLSAQSVSVIVRALEEDGLIKKGDKLRGKVGQPSVPMQLEPTGAYFLGLKVGRRSAELILVDFLGQEIAHTSQTYAYPTPETTLQFVKLAVPKVLENLSTRHRRRVSGLGIASPFFLWEWASLIGVEPAAMAGWKGFDLCAEVSRLVEFPVFLGNDGTSACGAELTFGTQETPLEFLYIYIGYFVGGGVVLNGALYRGRFENAGAIGPFPTYGSDGTVIQLIDKASLIGLERRMSDHVDDPTILINTETVWDIDAPHVLEEWLDDAVPSLAQLVVSACSIIDFKCVLIDGHMPGVVRARIVDRVNAELETLPMSGLVRPEALPGSLGVRARPLGAASLPLANRFLLEA